MEPPLPKEVFDDYAKARMQTLIEKGEIPSTIIGGFIDYFGDAELINCSKCETPVYIRPWLAEIAKKHNIKVECLCCADPQTLKGQVAMDFAKIENTIGKATVAYIKENWIPCGSWSGPLTQTPYSAWRSPDGKLEIGIHDHDNEIFAIHIVETDHWHWLIPARDIQRILTKLEGGQRNE